MSAIVFPQSRLFLYAFLISLAGSLPIGTLNVSIASLVIHRGWMAAVEFSATAIFVEVMLVRVAVMAVKKLEGLKGLHRVFGIVTCLVLLLFAWTSLRAAAEMQQFGVSLPFTDRSPWVAGFLLSLINPLHLPFWMGWSAVLRSKKLLTDRTASYNIFVIAIGAGTGAAFFIYGVAGKILIGFFEERQVLLNWVVGFAFLATALLQSYKMFFLRKPGIKSNAPAS